MKKPLMALMALAAGISFAAEQNDYRLTLSTKGPDSYAAAPRRTVLDGEFYALVWTKTAETPVVFKADGTVGGEVELVVAGPWAKGGRCGYVLHQIPASAMTRYAGGVFRLVALDTRRADGTLAGYTRDDAGVVRPKMVNGYSVVASMTPDAAVLSSVLNLAAPISISETSAVPEGTPAPVITGLTMRQGTSGQEMVIKVKGTAGYLNYTAASVGVNGGTSAPTGASATGSVDPEAEIEIVVPATGDSGFFKVIRK